MCRYKEFDCAVVEYDLICRSMWRRLLSWMHSSQCLNKGNLTSSTLWKQALLTEGLTRPWFKTVDPVMYQWMCYFPVRIMWFQQSAWAEWKFVLEQWDHVCMCGSNQMDGNIQVLTDCDPVYLIKTEIHSFHDVHVFMYIFL